MSASIHGIEKTKRARERKQFAKSLIVHRRIKDWSQDTLAINAGFAEASSRISNYETGKRIPDLHDLLALADAIDISLDELVQRKNNHDRKMIKLPFLEDWQSVPKFCRKPNNKKTRLVVPIQASKEQQRADFALIIEDQKMKPMFVPGDIITVDTQVIPEHLDFVLVKIKNEIVLRQHYKKENRSYLKTAALNSRLLLVTPNTPLYGVIVSRIKEYNTDLTK